MKYWIMATVAALALLATATAWSRPLELTLLQMNDVYEITAVGGGHFGGLARVATVRQRLLERNPNTFTILSGDCISPSALGTAKVDGEALAGRQMIEALNTLGLDFATFGNHEFDVTEAQFQKRLQESEFLWISGNVRDAAGRPFAGVPESHVFTVEGKGGVAVRVGLIGLTGPFNRAGYVSYLDPFEVAKAQVQALEADVVIAITHLSLEQDRQLAGAVPEIDLILGGHEHENVQEWRGADLTPIFKADANARTVYIHHLIYDPATRRLAVRSGLLPITDDIPDDPRTAAVVDKWVRRGFAGFEQAGFKPKAVVATAATALDGLEASVRNQSTALTRLIARGMLAEVDGAELALYNAGSIRIDDVIPAGTPVTEYDLIRIMPFGGKVMAVEMTGELLQRVLEQGRRNRGIGGYLQTAGVDGQDGAWLIGGEALDPQRTYRVAINDFLLAGKEHGLEFLTRNNPGVRGVEEKRDVRFALRDQLRREAATTSPSS